MKIIIARPRARVRVWRYNFNQKKYCVAVADGDDSDFPNVVIEIVDTARALSRHSIFYTRARPF